MNSAQTLYEDYPIASSLQGYFYIEPGPLIPIIYRNQSQITLTQGSTVILDPGDYTIDPNEPPGTSQVFSWCPKSIMKHNLLNSSNFRVLRGHANQSQVPLL